MSKDTLNEKTSEKLGENMYSTYNRGLTTVISKELLTNKKNRRQSRRKNVQRYEQAISRRNTNDH